MLYQDGQPHNRGEEPRRARMSDGPPGVPFSNSLSLQCLLPLCTRRKQFSRLCSAPKPTSTGRAAPGASRGVPGAALRSPPPSLSFRSFQPLSSQPGSGGEHPRTGPAPARRGGAGRRRKGGGTGRGGTGGRRGERLDGCPRRGSPAPPPGFTRRNHSPQRRRRRPVPGGASFLRGGPERL